MYSLRKALLSDVDSMAHVHVTCWQETYTDLLDSSVINKFNMESRKKMWSLFLQKEIDSQRAYVAVYKDTVVGIASWMESPDQVEFLTLYVLSKFQHQGIGRDLFRQVENDANEKKKSLIVWVLEGNSSIFFYKKMGLKLETEELKKLGDVFVKEVMLSNRHPERIDK